ncbi:PAS domain-containing sensor histidine kinase [Teichococcus vastitatis]|uniref:histidine kinase n=1 Tax=Teichococcus vastitatis TaxID=2307076 RepID=A0ABS9W6P3_9PROT|nr:PAS domain-containing sensor histidine kinase [Pseudoroseomonas vastitatis]MCI0754957.1 PAS domain-containing sensor histidine kinase [Pseudoroseomonas vastitatis]
MPMTNSPEAGRAGGDLPSTAESAEDLYEEAPFGYLSSQGIDGPILRLNRTLCRWTGHRAADLAGVRRLDDLLSPAGRIAHATRHIPLLRTAGAADGLALELVRVDGTRLPVLVNSVVRHASDGAPLLTRTTLFDATAYRRYETRLIEARDQAERSAAEARQALAAAEAADRAKARFLAAMNHEFRTPIGIIAGFAELLAEAAVEGRAVPAVEWTRDVVAASAHLLELLQDATYYARLSEAEQRFDPRRASLRRACRSALPRTAAVLEREGVTAVLDDGEEGMSVFDEELAAEAIACTVRELARRAGAKLHLHCSDEPAWLEVSCSTLLLAPEALAGLQAPLDGSGVLNRGLEGAGLGMAVAYRIVALHGGELRAEASTEGGTHVRLRFGPE